MARIQQVYFEFPETARILVVADLHARLDRFQQLLVDMEYQHTEDYLIIIGDIIEKGPQNMAVLAYVQELMECEKVFVLKGNCEAFVADGIGIQNYMVDRGNSLMTEMADAIGLSYDPVSISERQLHAKLRKAYAATYEWLHALPVALISPQFIFVHAAVDKGTLDEALQEEAFLLNHRGFLNDGHDLEQTVIVGHYPVINYCTFGLGSHAVVIDEKQRIIALDGGNQIDPAGQLNGLEIQLQAGVSIYKTYAVDEFPSAEITADFHPQFLQTFYSVFWPYGFEPAEVIERGKHFTFCEVKGIQGPVAFKNELITECETDTYTLDFYHVSYQLPIKKGANVRIVNDTLSKYSYIKEDGLLGWVPHTVVKKEE